MVFSTAFVSLIIKFPCGLNNTVVSSFPQKTAWVWKMPRKKVTDVSGNGGMKRKRASGKRRERDFSSDDEFDFEQENNKKSGKPTTKSGLQPVTVADDVKEKIVRLIKHRLTGFWKLKCSVLQTFLSYYLIMTVSQTVRLSLLFFISMYVYAFPFS